MKKNTAFGDLEKLILKSMAAQAGASGLIPILEAAIEALERGGRPALAFLKQQLEKVQRTRQNLASQNALLNPSWQSTRMSLASHPNSIVMRPKIKISLADAGAIRKHIPDVKQALRALVQQHGGVSKVALLMGKSQSNLSRFLIGPGLRMETIRKLAEALGVTEIEIDA
jgi:hypothetical protein